MQVIVPKLAFNGLGVPYTELIVGSKQDGHLTAALGTAVRHLIESLGGWSEHESGVLLFEWSVTLESCR